jgi:DNA-directed RNA polymerase specialized sigma subunit
LIQGYFIPLEITAKLSHIDNLKEAGAKDTDTRIADLQKEIAALGDKYSEIKRQIQEFTKDERFIYVLESRYISGLPLKDIAKRMSFCYDYTQRLHTRAVKAFGSYLAQNGIQID